MALTDDELVIANRALRAVGAQPVTEAPGTTSQGKAADLLYAPARDAVLAVHPWNDAITRVTLPGTADRAITAVDTGARQFTISGDYSQKIQVGDTVTVEESTGNDGDYTVEAVAFSTPNTVVTTEEAIPDATADGTMTVRNTFLPAWGYDHAHELPDDFIRLAHPRNPDDPWTIEGDRVLTDDADFDLTYVKQLTDPTAWSPLLADVIVAKLAAELVRPLSGDDRRYGQQVQAYELKLREARLADSRQSGPTEITRSTFLDARRGGYRRERTGTPVDGGGA